MELKRQLPFPSMAGLYDKDLPTEVDLHFAVMPRREVIAVKIGAELTAFIAAALHGCLEAQIVEQLSPAEATNQPGVWVVVERVAVRVVVRVEVV